MPSLTFTNTFKYFNVGVVSPAASSANQWRKQITVPSGLVAGELTDYPILLSASADSDFAAKASENDIYFTDNNNSPIPYEIESFSSSTGEIVAWFKGNLASANDNIFYIYYGSSDLWTTPSSASVWDSNYKAVWHLTKSGSYYNDSTANGKTGSAGSTTNSTSAAKIGLAARFNGANDRINIPNLLTSSSTLTIDAWFRVTGDSPAEATDGQALIDLRDQYQIWTQFNEDDSGGTAASKFYWAIYDGSDSITASMAASYGHWYRVAMTYGANSMKLYNNGVLVNSAAQSQAAGVAAGVNRIGKDYTGINRTWFYGEIDEIRVSSIARSPSWILTNYNNESSPTLFASLGSQVEVVPATLWRKQVTVGSQLVIGSLSQFPILLSIQDDSALSSRSKNNGEDLFMSTSAGSAQQIPYDITYFNKSTGAASIWFKGDLASDAETTFYLYYGGNGGINKDTVWDTNYTAVYHMDSLASTLGFAQNGTAAQPIHPPIIAPMGYYFNGKTYAVWQGETGLDPHITAYDHAAETWASQVKIGTNPLSGDDHGAPAILIDNTSYIHAFFGCHGADPVYHSRSTSPEDISTWASQTTIGGNGCTYPNALKDDSGTLYLFFRRASGGLTYWQYSKSENNGASWTSLSTLIDGTTDHIAYPGEFVYDSANERIHFAWYINNGSNQYFDICHSYFDLAASGIKTMAGNDMGSSISETEMDASALVVDSGTSQTWIPSVRLDASKNPHIIYPIEDGSGAFDYKYTYWTGACWTAPETITSSAGCVTSIGNFYFNGSMIEAYLTTDVSDPTWGRSGHLEHWRRQDGAWTQRNVVFNNNGGYPHYDGVGNPQIVRNASTIKVLFSDLDLEDYSHVGLEIFAIDNNDQFINKDTLISDTDTTATLRDSTTTRRLGTGTVSTASSTKINSGVYYDGATIRHDPNIDPNTVGWTIETWFTAPSIATGGGDIYSAGNTGDNNPYFRVLLRDYDASEGDGQIPRLGFLHQANNGTDYQTYGRTSLSANTWTYAAVNYSASSTATLYINGQPESQTTVLNTLSGATTTNADQIGALRRIAVSNYFYGTLDEFRVSSTSRSASWIETSFNNQSSPTQFVTVGAEEAG